MKVSLELMNMILGYLGRQPYADVAQLIARIQQEAQASQPKPKAAPAPAPDVKQ